MARAGYGQEGDRRRALEAGFDEHLTKPTRFDTLQRALAERAAAASASDFSALAPSACARRSRGSK